MTTWFRNTESTTAWMLFTDVKYTKLYMAIIVRHLINSLQHVFFWINNRNNIFLRKLTSSWHDEIQRTQERNMAAVASAAMLFLTDNGITFFVCSSSVTYIVTPKCELKKEHEFTNSSSNKEYLASFKQSSHYLTLNKQ